MWLQNVRGCDRPKLAQNMLAIPGWIVNMVEGTYVAIQWAQENLNFDNK